MADRQLIGLTARDLGLSRSDTYMVIVLVPTGTPFSADRQLEAERHYFGYKDKPRRAHLTTAESPRAYSATNGARRSCGDLRPTNAAARHHARTGPTSGRPLFPGVLRSRQSQAPGNAGEMLARGASRWGRTPSGPDERAGPAGWAGRIPPPTARLTGNGRLGHGCPTVRAAICYV